jgi:hypothetical protein
MLRPHLPTLLMAACCCVATVVWQVGSTGSERLALAANGTSALEDSDGDLVPDCVEWVMQTDPGAVDTHGDGVDDFLAILSYGNLLESMPEPEPEHGMRVVVTSATENGQTNVWLHLLVRFMVTRSLGEIYIDPYIDVQGMRASLVPVLGHGNVSLTTKQKRDSLYVMISCRLADEASLMRLLPCTLGAEGIFDSQQINTGTYVVDSGGSPHAMLPFTDNSFILQPINADARFQEPSPFWKGGRVCVLKLSIVSNSPNGHLCEVTSAECKPAPGLRCASSCSANVGQPVFVPGGLGTISGN